MKPVVDDKKLSLLKTRNAWKQIRYVLVFDSTVANQFVNNDEVVEAVRQMIKDCKNDQLTIYDVDIETEDEAEPNFDKDQPVVVSNLSLGDFTVAPESDAVISPDVLPA